MKEKSHARLIKLIGNIVLQLEKLSNLLDKEVVKENAVAAPKKRGRKAK